MNPELIHYARNHRYKIAEGFLDPTGSDLEIEMERSFERLPAEK